MPRSLIPVVALCFIALFAPASADDVARALPAKNQSAPMDGWPQILRDSSHSSVSPDTKLSAGTASKIGLNWMSAMRSSDIGSPVAAYNTALGLTVAYVGDERGDIIAFNESNGTTLWSSSIGVADSVRASPMVAPDGSVWAGTAQSSTIAKYDGSTGQLLCTVNAAMRINSSMMYASPTGGVPTVYTGTNHSNVNNGPLLAINESNCAVLWSFDKWLTLSGVWATPALGVDVNGNSKIFIGTADPDSTMYSVDALSGKSTWNYSALNPPDGTYDVGAAATVSAPGNNGFADGVLYFPSKYGVMYALNLTTGKVIWQYNFNKAAHVQEGGRSAASLYKTNLVYGLADGVENVDATTGKLLWHYTDPAKQEVLSSPAIAGPVGKEIVTFGDVTGLFTVLRLSDGKVLYKYQTGNYITSSPAIVNGHILIASTDGFLYDFVTGGGNVTSPSTTITSPATGSDITNPGSTLTVTGTATSNSGKGVTEVQLAIQRGGPNGPWYDSASGQWLSGAVNNFVGVSKPGQSSTWSFAVPVQSPGNTYQMTVNAVDLYGQVDRIGAQSSFAVKPGKSQPQLTLSTTLIAPGSSLVASGGPFKPNETVDFGLQRAVIGHGVAGSNGMVPNTSVSIPNSAEFGPSAFTATGETSHDASSAPVDITNVWTQLGFSAAHTGYETNDPVLANTLQSTEHGFLSLAWAYQTGAAVDTPAAVVGGSAYVANTMGSLEAIDTVSGALLWTYTIPSGAAIHGAPAVGNGDVVFGADDGNIYRVSSSSGTLIGSVALDGVPTAPAIAGGTIYVGTDNGSLYALSDATGNQVFMTAIGSPIHMSPSVDSGAGLAVVGDDSGNVTTLNATTGAEVRQVATNSTVTVPPAISEGRVFVGSSDGNLRTYNETTGALEWKYAAGASIHALSTTGTDVYVGNDAKTLAKISAKSGSYEYLDSSFDSALEGIAHSAGVSVVDTAAGHVNALKDDQGGRIQYNYSTGGTVSAQPVIVDGTIYVGGETGDLFAFTNHGQAPQGAIEHRFLMQLRKNVKTPNSWAAHPRVAHRAPILTSAFAPHGQRDFPIRLERSQVSAAAAPPTVANAPSTYILGWSPVAVRAAAFVDRARTLAGPVAGTALDTTAYPRSLDDAAVQREIARAIAANGWHASKSTRFVVLTAGAPISALTYCEYHSAFNLGGNPALPVIYGVVPAGTSEQCGPFGAQIGRESKEMDIDPFARGR